MKTIQKETYNKKKNTEKKKNKTSVRFGQLQVAQYAYN